LLAPRVAVLSNHLGCSLTPEEILEDFKSFYYETALSSYDASLAGLDKFVEPSQILHGTDFPAVSIEMAEWYSNNVRGHYGGERDILEMVLSGNALKLFPGLQQRRVQHM